MAHQLIPPLLEQGHAVRALVRGSGDRLRDRPWFPQVEVVSADVQDPSSLGPALKDIHTAYYLIHHLSSRAGFGQQDVQGARHFAQAATEAAVQRIIYLGGLVPHSPRGRLSEHLWARCETGNALRQYGPTVTEFRAAMIVGKGSLSFEILRHFVDTFPLLTVPRWMQTQMQPIAIADVVAYLIAALHTPDAKGQIIEIGGQDVLTQTQILQTFASIRGLRRQVLVLPGLSPRLTASLVAWSAPMVNDIAYPLIVGLRHDAVVHNPIAQKIFPTLATLDFPTAVAIALQDPA